MINSRCFSLRISMVVGMVWVASALAAQQGAATQAARQSITQLLNVLKDPTLKKSENKEKRRSEIMKIIQTRFDFAEMARRSLGRHWRELKEGERDEFTDLFAQFLQNTYIKRIEKYKNEKVVYKPEGSIGPGRAEVRTIIVTPSAEIPIYYRCMSVGKDWKVYDVVIEGVSLVNNYRSQFKQIMLKESYKGLRARLKTKIKKMNAAR
ncbi:MAG: ABC transporter substrate-binding protein [Deltaproteobacteria bacterium]|nr:ABC transporter substrate-binding protein [Deltaproteobacteria bacterium]MBW2306666.1 ABC transporter substrate-binding protein [Deltaproteobacteria bacterium]